MLGILFLHVGRLCSSVSGSCSVEVSSCVAKCMFPWLYRSCSVIWFASGYFPILGKLFLCILFFSVVMLMYRCASIFCFSFCVFAWFLVISAVSFTCFHPLCLSHVSIQRVCIFCIFWWSVVCIFHSFGVCRRRWVVSSLRTHDLVVGCRYFAYRVFLLIPSGVRYHLLSCICMMHL